MMRWIGRLLGGLLGLALFVTASAWVAGSTFLHAGYLSQVARDQGFYDAAAKVAPSLLAGSAPTGDQGYLLKQLVTPDVISQTVKPILDRLPGYYRTGETPPTLDLSNLAKQFAPLGIPVPSGLAPYAAGPVSLRNDALDPPLIKVAGILDQAQWLAPVSAAVLIVIIAVIMRRRRWRVLSGGFAVGAVASALAGGLVTLLPGLATPTLTSSGLGLLAPAVESLGTAISRDSSMKLLWWAVGYAGVAVALGLVTLASSMRGKDRKHKDE